MTNEEAIKEIQKWLNDCPFEDTKEAFDLAIKALNTQESLEKKIEFLMNERHGKWIPVSKQLPEKYDSYLVMWLSLTEGYPDRLFYEICEYEPALDEWDRIEQAGEAGAEIIAWMPLPEPYKEGGADNEKTDK